MTTPPRPDYFDIAWYFLLACFGVLVIVMVIWFRKISAGG